MKVDNITKKLNYLLDTKYKIRDAISAKKSNIDSSAPFSAYANYINNFKSDLPKLLPCFQYISSMTNVIDPNIMSIGSNDALNNFLYMLAKSRVYGISLSDVGFNEATIQTMLRLPNMICCAENGITAGSGYDEIPDLSLTLNIKDANGEGIPNIEVTLYRVGGVGEGLIRDFKECPIELVTDYTDCRSLKCLSSVSLMDGVSTTNIGATNNTGKVSFHHLYSGYYFIGINWDYDSEGDNNYIDYTQYTDKHGAMTDLIAWGDNYIRGQNSNYCALALGIYHPSSNLTKSIILYDSSYGNFIANNL